MGVVVSMGGCGGGECDGYMWWCLGGGGEGELYGGECGWVWW